MPRTRVVPPEELSERSLLAEDYIPKPLVTYGLFSGFKVRFVCDRKCNKAWGNNGRPEKDMTTEEHEEFSPNGRYHEDFRMQCSDKELGEAPDRSGIAEYTDNKPKPPVKNHNRWCVRECERCETYDPGEELYIYNRDHAIPNLRATILAEKHPEMVILVKEEEADVVKE